MNNPLFCPRDGTVLTQSRYNMTAYQCLSCQGMLVDLERTKSAPLRKLDESLVDGKSDLISPVTKGVMLRMDIQGFEVDYRPKGRVVWLDHNEFEVIVSQWLKQSEYKPKSPIPDVQSEVARLSLEAFTIGISTFLRHWF